MLTSNQSTPTTSDAQHYCRF